MIDQKAREIADKLLCGLSPAQAAAVVVTFFATLIGAILLAWIFRKYNKFKNPIDITQLPE